MQSKDRSWRASQADCVSLNLYAHRVHTRTEFMHVVIRNIKHRLRAKRMLGNNGVEGITVGRFGSFNDERAGSEFAVLGNRLGLGVDGGAVGWRGGIITWTGAKYFPKSAPITQCHALMLLLYLADFFQRDAGTIIIFTFQKFKGAKRCIDMDRALKHCIFAQFASKRELLEVDRL